MYKITAPSPCPQFASNIPFLMLYLTQALIWPSQTRDKCDVCVVESNSESFSGSAVFWKIDRIRLCLIAFHITWWTAVQKKHKMKPAEQPPDALLLMDLFPPSSVFPHRICAWTGPARSRGQQPGAHFSLSAWEHEVEFTSTHDLENMGCGSSASTKEKAHKGECEC